MNLARLALRTVLRGRPRAWGALLAVAGATCALALGAGRLPALALVACGMAAHTSLQALARRRELATLCALGMPRPALVLMLELEALWISAAGTLLGMGMGAAWRQVVPDQGAALPLAHAGPALSSLCTLAGPVLGVTLLAALVPAIRAARHDVARGLALIPAHQEG
jgi:putative ABC transport system permease protein